MKNLTGSAALKTAAALALLAAAPALQAGDLYSGASYFAPDSPLSEEFVLGPTSPGKWGGAAMGTPGGVVTWSLMATGVDVTAEGAGILNTHLSGFMPVGFHAAITAAFAAWSSIADISFVEMADNGLPFNAAGATADIRIGGHVFDGPSGTLAHGFFPPVNGTTAAGDIHFDIAEVWKIGFGGGGFDIFQVAAHEIGHAIGLAHTGVGGSLMEPFYTEAFAGPQADDIAGAVFIYGPAPEIDPHDPGIPEPSTYAAGAFLVVAIGWQVRRRLASKQTA